MLVPLNPKHEAFAQALAAGKTQLEAYSLAGFGRSTGRPAALAKDERIKARVAVLLEERAQIQRESLATAIERVAITRADVLWMLLEDRKKARDLDQISAAIKAAELIGKELGMFERRPVKEID